MLSKFTFNSLYLTGRQVLNVLWVISTAVAVFGHKEADQLAPIFDLILTSSATQCSLLSTRWRAPDQSGPQRWPGRSKGFTCLKSQGTLPQCGIQAQFWSPIYTQCYQDTVKSLFSSEKWSFHPVKALWDTETNVVGWFSSNILPHIKCQISNFSNLERVAWC